MSHSNLASSVISREFGFIRFLPLSFEVIGTDRQIFPSDHCLASLSRALLCQNSDPCDRIVYSYLTLVSDSYILHNSAYSYSCCTCELFG